LGPSNGALASLALSGRWGRRLDRPPRRGVASDSEIRRTTSFIWTPLAAHWPSVAAEPLSTICPHTAPNILHAALCHRPTPPRRRAKSVAASLQRSGSHTPKPRRAQLDPARGGVGLDQPSFASRITLNESLFSTSLRSLGGPTAAPALTRPKTSRCGPAVRQSVLSSLAPASTNTPSTAKAFQKPVSTQPDSPSRLLQIVAGHGMLGRPPLRNLHLSCPRRPWKRTNVCLPCTEKEPLSAEGFLTRSG
jgi:hypothetical protein